MIADRQPDLREQSSAGVASDLEERVVPGMRDGGVDHHEIGRREVLWAMLAEAELNIEIL
jgi:hypothetical protein